MRQRWPQFSAHDTRSNRWQTLWSHRECLGFRYDVMLVWCGDDPDTVRACKEIGYIQSRLENGAIVVAMDESAVTCLDRLQFRHVRMSDLINPRPEKSELSIEELATGRMMAITNANLIIENERLKSEVRSLRAERIGGKPRVACDSGWDD